LIVISSEIMICFVFIFLLLREIIKTPMHARLNIEIEIIRKNTLIGHLTNIPFPADLMNSKERLGRYERVIERPRSNLY